MDSTPFQPNVQPPWHPMVPPNQPSTSAFWETRNALNSLKDLHDTLSLAKSMSKELEMLMVIKDGRGSLEVDNDDSNSGIFKILKDRRIDIESQVSLSVETANSLMFRLRAQIEPFRVLNDEMSPWEEKCAAMRLSNKMKKSKRNKYWRKKKRKLIAEMIAKEHERFDQADQEADEWRAREIANDIAKRKVEKMKEIAKLKAKEERKRLESELELVLIVEKLQELRSIRIQKLKKQGHFLPEEDDKFLERVQAAVEEEERQAIAAADTEAAKGAIATAEESRKATYNLGPESKDISPREDNNQDAVVKNHENSNVNMEKESGKQALETQVYDSVANLPIEFYHYYHGSNTDIGTLIEVRRTWDAYIRPGGSRIPWHWVQPPPPANEIWASYLMRSK
ncbi:U11/U12 small nuclear ribonucleoprotein 59 kDa protein-like [Humulus lupulus]|uniref:U11/U12 small nuclear ribonucleoprotein 59 kDa protein-like n=1 Tax=Humulus lupulus TaxID=3486 RepID=UPI002B411BFD|nr:U11/U12 small nuclear ribonucleoprotein 59 kDa protein-like [Humulus lupulus]XP_062105482.1 U11/U12 small nuclear ribonucleoprotein 59 kDa protein-like [Humulus lupulus]XP_062105483.1 U11/U12 small nuclear ribonucleoprotein 59 kDa protein-like [Humulus lupulus]XP_062105484.1 U11/U12 small nuclear ribonucleoprotein 59 kDa protein-like [Humulus lupulus]XP_062105485.1 U11/U12 small nuclear ribonucleoprotein 59 kDa protein-like [Humulus lupulus]